MLIKKVRLNPYIYMEKLFKHLSDLLVTSIDILGDEYRDYKEISKKERQLKRQKKKNLICLLLS